MAEIEVETWDGGKLDHLRQAELALAAARRLHPNREELAATGAESGLLCPECIAPAPCKTRRILDGEEMSTRG